ncbi:histidine phosphatase family protein [Bacillus atrophaeus]|uniref:histidine phosphatase family protein n=1 Tax=Bacillus atrophaeus TaxID=1452 RepID=UPI00228C2819|nr:histidine phosphatase family protein [Bacillus atrophaeus]MCY8098400.1 histidine phosphatase family protein [Bacillus atrophaeus]
MLFIPAQVGSSPSLRAVQTAEIIIGDRDMTLIKKEDLYEMDIGSWDGKKLEDIARTDRNQLTQFLEHPELFSPEEGESFYDVQNRVISFLSHIKNDHKNQSILIISHTVALKLLMCHFKGQTIEDIWEPPEMKNASLSLVHIHNEEVSIELYADDSHLGNISVI